MAGWVPRADWSAITAFVESGAPPQSHSDGAHKRSRSEAEAGGEGAGEGEEASDDDDDITEAMILGTLLGSFEPSGASPPVQTSADALLHALKSRNASGGGSILKNVNSGDGGAAGGTVSAPSAGASTAGSVQQPLLHGHVKSTPAVSHHQRQAHQMQHTIADDFDEVARIAGEPSLSLLSRFSNTICEQLGDGIIKNNLHDLCTSRGQL